MIGEYGDAPKWFWIPDPSVYMHNVMEMIVVQNRLSKPGEAVLINGLYRKNDSDIDRDIK